VTKDTLFRKIDCLALPVTDLERAADVARNLTDDTAVLALARELITVRLGGTAKRHREAAPQICAPMAYETAPPVGGNYPVSVAALRSKNGMTRRWTTAAIGQTIRAGARS